MANGLGRNAHLFQALTELPYLAKRPSQEGLNDFFAMESKDAGCLCCEKYANHWGPLLGLQFFVDGGFLCTYKGITRLLGRGSVRITPAHAGKRERLAYIQRVPGDHPRACGEKKRFQSTGWQLPGSPPRVRGKGGELGHQRVQVGITPARAGKRLLHAR